MELALRISSVLVLVYLGVCVLYFLFQERFIFVPFFEVKGYKNKIGRDSETFLIPTPHNGNIHALLVKAENPKGLIFYLHGNTGGLNRWQVMADELASYGFDVFTMDYRGYGKSTGRRTEAIMHRDAEYCFDWACDRFNHESIIIYGRSLGSGFATRLAARRRANALVLETPFYNLIDVAKFYLPFFPVSTLLRFKFRNDQHILHVNCPIKMFHGTADKVVPYSSAFKLFSKAHKIKDIRLTTIAGGKHSNLNAYPLFREQMQAFFSEVLCLNSHRDV